MIDLIIERVQKARKVSADSYMACCPAHEDKSPSMRITERDGKILVHCMAGCTPDDILAAIGLTWADLFEDKMDAARQAATSQKTRLPRIDPMEHERTILFIYREDRKAGRDISMEDAARVKIAIERLGAAS